MTDHELAVIVQAIAPVVRECVTKAVSELTPRLAAAEARLALLPETDKAITDLRERVVVVETKAAQPIPVPVVPAPPVDLTPVLDRISGLHERVVTVETKSSLMPTPDFEGLARKVMALETKAAVPGPPGPAGRDGEPGKDAVIDVTDLVARIVPLIPQAKDGRDGIDGKDGLPGRDGRDGLPGIPGEKGINGTNGTDGKNGVDGLGWDDLSVEHDGERAFTVKVIRGERSKEVGTFSIPAQLYRGVFSEGRTYEPGDMITYARSLWSCRKTTVMKPDGITRDPITGEAKGGPQGKDFWQLIVAAGRDGKDGKDAPSLPVVSIGGSRSR